MKQFTDADGQVSAANGAAANKARDQRSVALSNLPPDQAEPITKKLGITDESGNLTS